MSTSACGAGGPNGAVGGLDDTSVPGAGECGYELHGRVNDGRPTYSGGRYGNMWVFYHAGCGLWIVGDEADIGSTWGYMYVEGRNAATPAAATATWDVVESSKPNSSLAVTAVGENGIRIAGLAAGHVHADHMGEYTRQADPEAGELWYKGGRDSDSAVWYDEGGGYWGVGAASDVGTSTFFSDIFAKSAAGATPDAVQAGTWETVDDDISQPNSAVRCTEHISSAAPPPGLGHEFVLLGLPARHTHAHCMGTYYKFTSAWTLDGRPVYKGGEDGDMWVWFCKSSGRWWLGPEWFLGTPGGFLRAEDHGAATPHAITATWELCYRKRDSSLVVTAAAGGKRICITGLAAGHDDAHCMGEYTMQAGLKGGKPWYKGGSDGKMAVWYVDDNADKHHPGTQWVIGFARHVGKMCSSIAATSSAVTPDAVQAGTWDVALPWQPNSEVRSVSPDTALGLLMA